MTVPSSPENRLVARCSALALLVLCASAAVPASAAYPGSNGALLYTGSSGDQEILYVRSGHRVKRLLAGSVAQATWSPRGRRVAFRRDHAIWVMNAEATDLRQLSAAGAPAEGPTWAPDGSALAYSVGAAPGRHVYVQGADGNSLRRLTGGTHDQRDPAWSRRGRIAFVQRNDRGGDDVYTVSAAGGRTKRLTKAPGNDTGPAWSPDGRRIAFVRGKQGVWLMDADGRRKRRLADVRGSVESGPAWSPDGRQVVFSAGSTGRRRIFGVRSDGRGLHEISRPSSNGRDPDWQPRTATAVIMAAGDIACDPESKYFNNGEGIPRHCGQRRTSDLLLRADLDAVLPVGDTQYGGGDLPQYAASFNPSWGRVKSLLRPVPGNHEYAVSPTAEGYFDYFDGPGEANGLAGPRGLGYYSYDVGSWHVIALNAACERLEGGCGAGSPEEQWLRRDLAAHPNRCTLAYYHYPLFSSYRDRPRARAFYQALYDAGVEVVINGHHHYYERFVPQDPTGRPDGRGPREFIVATGGDDMLYPPSRRPTSVVLSDTTFGVLRLDLRPGGYSWRFLSASADPFTDRGSDVCH